MIGRLAKQKMCVAKFVPNENIKNVISCASNVRSSGKKGGNIIYDRLKADDITQDLDDDAYKPSTVLSVDEQEVVLLDSVYSATPKSRKKSPKVTKQSPKSITKTQVSSRVGSCQKHVKTSLIFDENNCNEDAVEGSGYYSLRMRLKEQMNLNDSMADSDLENSENELWEDYSASDNGSEDDSQPSTPKTPRSARNMMKSSDHYFAAQKQSKSTTSNHTMAKVIIPQTNILGLRQIFQNTEEYHKTEKVSLHKRHKGMFEKWDFLLQEGFSVLLYGVGSKIKVLQDFCDTVLKDKTYIVVNGFFPSLTTKQILNSITEEVMEHEGTFPSIFEHAEFIKRHFQSGNDDLYIVVHNIDGAVLRGRKSQSVLSSLAASPHIHFIASVDHINCFLIWDQIMLSLFKWVCHDTTTYEPYILETSYGNSLLIEQSNRLLLSSLVHVLQSLTPNARRIFMILANLQMSKKDMPGFLGVSFQDWYRKSRDEFLVNSELTMNAQLSEFKNHKLLASRKSVDGVEYWYIPVDNNTLSEFMEKEDAG